MRVSKLVAAGIFAGFLGLLANEVLISTPRMVVSKDDSLKAEPHMILADDSLEVPPLSLLV